MRPRAFRSRIRGSRGSRGSPETLLAAAPLWERRLCEDDRRLGLFKGIVKFVLDWVLVWLVGVWTGCRYRLL